MRLSAGTGEALVPVTLLAAIAGLCAYSLSTRLAPTASEFNAHDLTSHYRLFNPIGYWNGLGLFAVLGILLALALVTEPAARIEFRIFASVSLVVLPVTLFFTFSRGAWLALVVGLLGSLAASPNRLRLVAGGAAAAVPPAIAVALAWRAGPLTHQGARLAPASHAGHRLAFELLGVAAASVAIPLLLRVLERTVRLGVWTRRAVALGIVAVAAAGLAVGVARAGGPTSIASRA